LTKWIQFDWRYDFIRFYELASVTTGISIRDNQFQLDEAATDSGETFPG